MGRERGAGDHDHPVRRVGVESRAGSRLHVLRGRLTASRSAQQHPRRRGKFLRARFPLDLAGLRLSEIVSGMRRRPHFPRRGRARRDHPRLPLDANNHGRPRRDATIHERPYMSGWQPAQCRARRCLPVAVAACRPRRRPIQLIPVILGRELEVSTPDIRIASLATTAMCAMSVVRTLVPVPTVASRTPVTSPFK